MTFDESLIDLIDDAPFAEDGWERVTAELEKPLGVRSSFLCLVDRRTGNLDLSKTANFSAQLNMEYANVYAAFDPAPAWAMRNAHKKLLFSDADFGPDATPAGNPYYEWFEKVNDTGSRFGAHVVTYDEKVLALTFHRLTARGAVTDGDIESFRPLVRHIVRALELQYRLGVENRQFHALASFYDQTEDAILFLDKAGRLTFANAATEQLAEAGDGLSLTAEGLRFHRLVDDTRFRRALAAATAAVPRPPSLPAPRPTGRRDYLVRLTPLGDSAALIDPKAPRVAVQIADPDRAAVQPEERLMQAYGLTRAETRLAGALGRGMTLKDASDALGVSYSTVRTQLRGIFAKTGVNRQTDLIRLISMLR